MIKIKLRDGYYPCICLHCFWQGSSGKTEGGMPIADTGDYDDIYCPICNSVDLDDKCPHYELVPLLKHWFKFRWVGLLSKRKARKAEEKYYNKLCEDYQKEQDALNHGKDKTE